MRLDTDIDKTAYLLVCTGRYKELFDGFHKSFRKYFNDDLYVLTDDPGYFSNHDATPLYIEHSPWPGVVMKKYSNILKYRDVFSRYRKMVCLQVNMRFVNPIAFLFNNLLFCFHPYNENKEDYLCCGLCGGFTKPFLVLCEWCDLFLEEHPNAMWHDETALNVYWMLRKPKCTILPSYTMYAEEAPDRFKRNDSSIMVLDKTKFFGASKEQYSQ